MGDEDGRHAALARQLHHEVHDGLLGRHVEAGGRLVGDEQARPAGQCQRNDDALAHAAGELERIGVIALLGPRDADLLQDVDGLVARIAARRLDVLHQHVLDLAADLADRIEGGARILEHHGHFAPTHVAHVVFRGGAHVEALEHH